MNLHENQLKLILHLIKFNILDYDECLNILNDENKFDRTELSYLFRPLTRNKYLSKNKDNIVSILLKGKEIFPDVKPLIALGGGKAGMKRVLQISKIAALMTANGVTVSGELPDKPELTFIPSACWRKMATGILSTTRFAGMLLAGRKKYSVYDIGDGSMEWQVRAESSLFYTRYGSYETKADGMILICKDGMKEKIAENIIRQTMWNRRSLLDDEYSERNRPVAFSRSPIKLRTQYEHVYLTTVSEFRNSIDRIIRENKILKMKFQGLIKLREPKNGDYEKWPDRYFFNLSFDLLKFVYFFSAVKTLHGLTKNTFFPIPDTNYKVYIPRQDLYILKIYPDVLNSERVHIYEDQFDQYIKIN